MESADLPMVRIFTLLPLRISVLPVPLAPCPVPVRGPGPAPVRTAAVLLPAAPTCRSTAPADLLTAQIFIQHLHQTFVLPAIRPLSPVPVRGPGPVAA